MQISVLPSDPTDFLEDTEYVTITASAVPREDFAIPSAPSVPSAKYEEITGASALIASTMALGTLAYTLF